MIASPTAIPEAQPRPRGGDKASRIMVGGKLHYPRPLSRPHLRVPFGAHKWNFHIGVNIDILRDSLITHLQKDKEIRDFICEIIWFRPCPLLLHFLLCRSLPLQKHQNRDVTRNPTIQIPLDSNLDGIARDTRNNSPIPAITRNERTTSGKMTGCTSVI